MNKIKILLVFFVFTGFRSMPYQSEGDKIIGIYLNEQGNARVEMYQKSGKYFGKVVWVNPNAAQNKEKGRSILGMTIVSNLVYENQKWIGGSIYSPLKEQTAACEMKIADNGKDLMVTVKKGFLSSTKIWKRL
ncbi:DUF2147 domain-containing protein [Arcicella rigui]|uniref:DUF2147 domain-containing protein n=1 Tax=Arcicella rigui TaxID=797020 RepID=A0ABU5Q9F9_9BACT|nr:DUF2147 domain-containing protein [Arcicella rigui]MEA5139243.1 DUF2147 domain-containing protein [Arcicella rigui]